MGQKKRECLSLLSVRANNANTAGSSIGTQLRDIIAAKGDATDLMLLKFESNALQGHLCTADEISQAAQNCRDMVAIIKTGQKLACALKSWFNPV